MPKIYKYQKVTDSYTIHSLLEPDYQEGDNQISELCTIDGDVYISVPDGVALPDQPEIISQTLVEVTLDDELKMKIKAVSSHIQLINQRVRAKIEADLSLSDELESFRDEIARIKEELAVSEDVVYKAINDKVIAHRKWGREEKAKLGL